MTAEQKAFLTQVNFARYHGQSEGHYESYFQRANHPTRPLAFWIRYTLHSPKAHPEVALGALWAVFFNGETHHHLALKQESPMSQCVFSPSDFRVEIENARLDAHKLHGAIQSEGGSLAWDLAFSGHSEPLLLLPYEWYGREFPSTKLLVGVPFASYRGRLSIDGETLPVADWVGSQNHNWGPRLTDRYAWGQVAGFDTHPDSFLEVATARTNVEALATSYLTLLVLRHRGEEHRFNGLTPFSKASGLFDYSAWQFQAESLDVELEGTISAPREAFVGFNYRNPPGGIKHCLNSMIAACTVRLKNRASGTTETLETRNRACFEILTDDEDHGIPISA